jgi:hypothetical protein
VHNGIGERNADEKVKGKGDPEGKPDIDTGIRSWKRGPEGSWNGDVGSAPAQNRKKKRIPLFESTEVGNEERATT